MFDKVCKAQGKRRPFLRLDMIAQEGLEQGFITQEEADLLREAEQHRLDTINVDDFEPETACRKAAIPSDG